MHTLLCATTNNQKFGVGHAWFKKYGIDLQQIVIEADEIQGEDPEVIIRDKVRRAFEAVGKPVVVTDDTWNIPGLKGFPGPYMKAINYWFTPEDLVRLTRNLADRRIILHQYIAYQDEYETVIFSKDITGTLSREPRGKTGPTNAKVTIFDADNGNTLAEIYDAGLEHEPERLKRRGDAWGDMAQWYAQKVAA
ncbi:MAG: non-canonical purine NTP pyrophosphatase [Candidatus Saccharimonadales bacterium]